jgi:hypothetical protein
VPEKKSGIEKRVQDILRLDDHQFHIALVWLWSALACSGPYPILRLVGEDCVFVASALRTFLDPHAVPVRGAPRNQTDGMISATVFSSRCMRRRSQIVFLIGCRICIPASALGRGSSMLTMKSKFASDGIR